MTDQKARTRRLMEPFSSPGVAVASAIALALSVALFNLFPGIDIAASRMFFTDMDCPAGLAAGTVCGRFAMAEVPLLAWTRGVLHVLPIAAAAAIGAALAWRLATARRLRDGRDVVAAALITALALGAGVIVNLVLKEISGRPRPRDSVPFGGDLPFVPAGRFTDYCLTNCSFVSGESAAAFWLMGLACLLPQARRKAGLIALGAIATLGALLRVIFGAHYLSDAVAGALISIIVLSIVANLFERLAASRETGGASGR